MIRLINRVETGVKNLKQSVVEHPWYDPGLMVFEWIMLIFTIAAIHEVLQTGVYGGHVVAGGVAALFFAMAIHDHYRYVMRWRDQT